MGTITPIEITSDEYQVAAMDDVARMRSQALRRPTQDQGFHADSNVMGVAAELAVVAYLRRHAEDGTTVSWIADEPTAWSDVEIRGRNGRKILLEVKAFAIDRWSRHGRTISEDQLYSTDATAYVWCVANRENRRPVVYLMGWSDAADIRAESRLVSYTGNWDRFKRDPSPNPPVGEPRMKSAGYDYDVDDWSNDEYENYVEDWEDSPILGSVGSDLSGPAEAGPDEVRSRPPGNWDEGNEPLPGFRKSKTQLQAIAPINPMATLLPTLL